MSERIIIGIHHLPVSIRVEGQNLSAPVMAHDYYGKHDIRWVKRKDGSFALEHKIGGPEAYEWVEVPFIKEPEDK